MDGLIVASATEHSHREVMGDDLSATRDVHDLRPTLTNPGEAARGEVCAFGIVHEWCTTALRIGDAASDRVIVDVVGNIVPIAFGACIHIRHIKTDSISHICEHVLCLPGEL